MKPFIYSRSNAFFDPMSWGQTRNGAELTKQYANTVSNIPFVPREAGNSAKVYNASMIQRIMRVVKGPRY